MDREVEKNEIENARARRALALVLGVAGGLMCVVVAAVLIAVALADDRAAFVEAEALSTPRQEYERNPANERLRERIRDLDEKLRAGYFYRRRLASVGGGLLLVGGVALVLALRLYAHVPVAQVRPDVKRASAEDEDDERAATIRSRLAGVGSVGAAAVLILGVVSVAALTGWGRVRPRNGQGPPPAAAGTFEENWHQFRGPTGMGIVPEGDWPEEWDAATGRNILWKVEVPETGKSSPIVWGDRVYLTGGDQDQQFVMCFSAETGALLWNSGVNSPAAWKNDPKQRLEDYEETGFAAPTPVTDGRRVVAFFGTADVACFDADGRQIWARSFGRPESTYGLSASLALGGEKVFLQLDQGADAADGLSKILAMDIATGRILWSMPRPVLNSWASPVLIDTGGRTVLVTCADPFVIAYDPADGRELWRASGLSGDVAPSPVYADGLFFVTNDGAQLMGIREGGSGDVTKTHVKWTDYEGMPDTASPLTDGRVVLQPTSHGSVSCHDAKEGKLLWAEDIGAGAVASPALVGSRVYLSDTEGVTHIFEFGGEYAAGAKCPIGEKIEASLAFVKGKIYIRGESNLYCIGNRKAPDGGE